MLVCGLMIEGIKAVSFSGRRVACRDLESQHRVDAITTGAHCYRLLSQLDVGCVRLLIMVFVLADIAKEFGTGLTAVTIAITVTLAARPAGALLFGYLADRAGRRIVLIINVLTFTVFELISGLAPSLVTFILIRGLFGVAMGGEWGVGASLTMESIPSKWRGAASGLLQAGYPCGYLLASLLYWAAFAAVGWRMLFVIGAIPGVLVALYIFLKVEESPDWLRRKDVRGANIWQTVSRNLSLMIYAVLMMTAINFYAHGTQDLTPAHFYACSMGFLSPRSPRSPSVTRWVPSWAGFWFCLIAKNRTASSNCWFRVAIDPRYSALGLC